MGAMNNVAGVFLGIVVIGVIVVVGFLIMSQAKQQLGEVEGIDETNATACAASVGCNATSTMQESMDDAVSFMPIVVIAAIGAVLIGLVSLFKSRG